MMKTFSDDKCRRVLAEHGIAMPTNSHDNIIIHPTILFTVMRVCSVLGRDYDVMKTVYKERK